MVHAFKSLSSGFRQEVLFLAIIRDMSNIFPDLSHRMDLESAMLSRKLFIVAGLIRRKVYLADYLGPFRKNGRVLRYFLSFRCRSVRRKPVRHANRSRALGAAVSVMVTAERI